MKGYNLCHTTYGDVVDIDAVIGSTRKPSIILSDISDTLVKVNTSAASAPQPSHSGNYCPMFPFAFQAEAGEEIRTPCKLPDPALWEPDKKDILA